MSLTPQVLVTRSERNQIVINENENVKRNIIFHAKANIKLITLIYIYTEDKLCHWTEMILTMKASCLFYFNLVTVFNRKLLLNCVRKNDYVLASHSYNLFI